MEIFEIESPNEELTLRDWFAGLAMQGMLADPQVAAHPDIAKDAYYMADLMMEVREKKWKN